MSTAYSYDNANRLTRLSHTTGGGSVTLGDYVFAVDAVGNRTAITETVASVGQGGDLRPLNGPVQILLPFVGNQAAAAQPTIQSSQNPILLPFLSNGGVGQSQTGPTLFPIRPAPRVPAQAPTAAATKAAPPTKTAAPQTAVPPQVATLVPGKPRGELPAARLEQARAGASLLALAGVTETTTINYSYDRLYRVTGASYTGTLTNTFGYSYDAVGNRTVQTQTITSTLVTNYSYDIANRLTSVNGVTYSWDDNGNLLNDGMQAYTYDQANRLGTVVQGGTTTTFGYNGVGDRLQQTVGITTTHYVLDPAAGLTQVLADGTNTYLYGNARIGQYQTAMQYFGADGLGSVRQIYDASAQVVGSSRYDPYGNMLSQSGATSVFAFTGEQYDAATGLEYLRARYYSAAQGRFVTRDVWEGDPNAPMSYNRWLYAYANAANRIDPSGQQSPCNDFWTWLQQTIGMLINLPGQARNNACAQTLNPACGKNTGIPSVSDLPNATGGYVHQQRLGPPPDPKVLRAIQGIADAAERLQALNKLFGSRPAQPPENTLSYATSSREDQLNQFVGTYFPNAQEEMDVVYGGNLGEGRMGFFCPAGQNCLGTVYERNTVVVTESAFKGGGEQLGSTIFHEQLHPAEMKGELTHEEIYQVEALWRQWYTQSQ